MELNLEDINNTKFSNSINYNNSLINSNYINKERNKNENNIDYEKYKNNFYTFREFKCNHKKNNEYYKMNIPHYSFYHYFDKSYYIKEPYKTNLLKESTELKKMSKFLQNELNRVKNEKIIGNKYIKILENEINTNIYNIYGKNKLNNYNNDKLLMNISNKKNFNYKEFKNIFKSQDK